MQRYLGVIKRICKSKLFKRYLLIVLAILALISSSIFFSSKNEPTLPSHPTNVPDTPALSLSKALPVQLRIPKIALEVPFTEPLGLDQNNEVAVPDVYDAVGWYKYSPTPGEIGPAVVLGHVDSYTGPAVFFSLGQLKPGDDIYIERADGSTAHFQVTHFERYEQDDFPTAKVYGDIDHAGLRLITCTGTFLRNEQRYTQNLVVYARLVTE